MLKKVLNIIIKSMVTVVVGAITVTIFVICLFSLSPIYDWEPPKPFSGDKIYNPYQSRNKEVTPPTHDTHKNWTRGTFHTHTKVDKGINECPYYPDVVYDDYSALGYGVVAFTNHNALTTHPYSDTLDLKGYEHGYNIFKLHYNVFGASKVLWFDPLLPIFDSQKQFKMNLLRRDSYFISFNHPDRTHGISSKTMERISGYKLIEGDSGFQEKDHGEGCSLHHWDEALSAGRYSHNILSDDNHNSKNSLKTARRSTWINTKSPKYKDVSEALLCGDFYSMRTPPHKEGESLPQIEKIGMRGDTIYLSIDALADSIQIISQNGVIRENIPSVSSIEYIMGDNDPYIRLTAYFPNNTTIYTNAFARYSQGESPYKELTHPINWAKTLLFNIGILILAVLDILLGILLIRRVIKR